MSERLFPRAVLVSMSEDSNGVRVTLDDVVPDDGNGTKWRKECLYTYKDYASGEIESLVRGSDAREITEKEFADFGLDIFARLSAFLKTRKT